MNVQIARGFAATLLVLIAVSAVWSAEPAVPPAPPPRQPTTLWSFLGVKQSIDKHKEHVVVHKEKKAEKKALHGGHAWSAHLPCIQHLCGHLCQCGKCQLKKPPVKPLADPENLESQNPAIRAAAEIKAEEDLAPQKIKALRYLATIGCGCYPQVKPALLAALDDCTEQVRVEAAHAFLRVAGSPCTVCNSSTCCDPEVREKLRDKAHGTDAQGCWNEPSASVRSAAAVALQACEMIAQPEEAPPPEERRELPQPETPAPDATLEQAARRRSDLRPEANGPAAVRIRDDARSDTWRVSSPAAGVAPASGLPSGTRARAVAYPGGEDALQKPVDGLDRQAGAPEEAEPIEPIPEAARRAGPMELAGTFGAAAGPASAAPNMIGDFFGSGGARFTGMGATNVSAGTAGGDRRYKIVESNNPIPTDRVFFNYHFFANPLVNIAEESVDLHRYTFGLEKAFFDDRFSVEVRVPFASGYNSDQSLADGASLSATEFGDVALAAKGVLLRRDCLLVSAGLGLTFPTGADWRGFDDDGELRVILENESMHLQPFLGAQLRPNDRLFVTFFTQADFDTSGNRMLVRDFESNGAAPREAGTLQEQALLFADVSAGYWVYRDPCNRLLTGIAPVIELHYSTTMQGADAIADDTSGFTLGMDPAQGVGFGRRDVLNLTGGLHVEVNSRSTLTVAGVVPLRSDGDRDYDAEFAVQFNRRF